MTKMKSKKMSKSTFAVIIMAIVMVAMLAFGGTYAYFTAKATDATGTLKVGTVAISTGDDTTIVLAEKYAVPGSKICDDKAISLTNTSTVDIYVFAQISATLDGKVIYVGETDNLAVVVGLGTVTENTWAQVGSNANVYGYKVAGNNGEGNPTGIANFTFDLTMNSSITEEYVQGVFNAASTNLYTKAENGSYTKLTTSIEGKDILVTVSFKAIQTIGTDGNEMQIAAAWDLVK